MAECMLFRMAMIGAVIGVFALATIVGKIAHATWYLFDQRKERHVWPVLALSGCW